MVTKCLLLYALNHSPHSLPLSDTHLTTYTEMTRELVMLERLSQLASLSAVLLISVMLFGVFVWWCFLFGSPPPTNTQATPLSAFFRALSQITAALKRPSHMPADQIHSH